MADREWVLQFRVALWPELDEKTNSSEFERLVQNADETPIFVAEDEQGRIAGFLEASLRKYADCCSTSPVGYIEGWYVLPEYRKKGIGKALVAEAERWARERGCQEMGSDELIENHLSQRVHRQLGYEEVERLVIFRKKIG